MLRAPAAIRGVQLEGPDIVRRLPAPCWRHAGHAPAALCLMRSCQARVLVSVPLLSPLQVKCYTLQKQLSITCEVSLRTFSSPAGDSSAKDRALERS